MSQPTNNQSNPMPTESSTTSEKKPTMILVLKISLLSASMVRPYQSMTAQKSPDSSQTRDLSISPASKPRVWTASQELKAPNLTQLPREFFLPTTIPSPGLPKKIPSLLNLPNNSFTIGRRFQPRNMEGVSTPKNLRTDTEKCLAKIEPKEPITAMKMILRLSDSTSSMALIGKLSHH